MGSTIGKEAFLFAFEHFSPFAADFDNDGDVDADDLALLEVKFGAYDGGNFLDWQRGIGSSSAAADSHFVPEPTSFALLLAAFAVVARRPSLSSRHQV